MAITHQQHSNDYHAGYEAMVVEIDGMGWIAARDKFNTDNPLGAKPKNLGAYYYAKGGCDALSDKMK